MKLDLPPSPVQYDKRQAAAYVCVSLRTFERLLAQGLIEYHLVGSRRKFSQQQLDDFLARQVVGQRKPRARRTPPAKATPTKPGDQA